MDCTAGLVQAVDELEVLSSALNASVAVLQSALKAGNLPPLSLDDPAPHPLDFGLPSPVLWYARKAIVGLCGQITALVQSPCERAAVHAISATLPAALSIMTESEPSIPDLIAKAGADGLHVSQISERTGIEEGKLRSIFRILTCHCYFKEVSEACYALNRPASALLQGQAISDLVCVTSGPFIGPASALPSTVLNSQDGEERSAFHRFHGMPLFPWLQQHPVYLDKFHRGMKQMETYLDPGIIEDYAWDKLGENVTIVDIGSGMGGLTLDLLQKHSGWKAVLYDRSEVVEGAKKFWEMGAPDLEKSGRVFFQPHDLMEGFQLPDDPQTEYVFLIKNVLHNCTDAVCVKILQNLFNATKQKVALLIASYCPAIPASTSRIDLDTFFNRIEGKHMRELVNLGAEAPAPLLHDWGCGSGMVLPIDPLMLVLLNARGRTETDFRRLLETTSWKLEAVTPMRASISMIKAIKQIC